MSRNNILITLGSIASIFVFLWIVYAASNSSTPQSSQIFKASSTVLPTDHVKWNTKAKKVLIEYSDLQCPACQSFHTILKQIEASGSAQQNIVKSTAFVYRNYPLTTIHKNAQIAALAAEAASKQGKVFEFHDILFTNQADWSKLSDPMPKFREYVRKLELDEAKFDEDVKSAEVKKKVADDVALGNQSQVNSTPSFFLNGKKLEFGSFDEFVKLLAQ